MTLAATACSVRIDPNSADDFYLTGVEFYLTSAGPTCGTPYPTSTPAPTPEPDGTVPLFDSTSIMHVVAYLAEDVTLAADDGEVLVLDATQSNFEGAYDTSSGMFTAPVDGVYLVSLKLSVVQDEGDSARVELALDGVKSGYGIELSGQGSDNAQGDLVMPGVQSSCKIYLCVRLKILTNVRALSGHRSCRS